ncbi:restriction endonuclease subunit S [Stutzerimonas stutzeri]|uniref:Restriction endonuclease subunit S n=2 Tax=Stutzerimonas stutzeri TaxID=316 RepID=A0A2N8RFZ6_STUST|nr:restriction endonuclease subunit S [Stutzerimonas stutzeri]
MRYGNYKSSGEGWLGEVPSHWHVVRLKTLFREKKHRSNMALPCGSISFGEVVQKNDEMIPESTKKSYQEVLSGEFLVNPLNLNYDLVSLRIALSEIDVVVSAGYIVLQSAAPIDSGYFKYLLHCYDVSYMKLLGSGVRQTISFGHISSSLLLCPPLKEQSAIYKFLDIKSAQVDQAVRIKERQIERLKERKQILIQQAVTRGLDPHAPMRDSGVEWIGEIPAHWETVRLKYLFKEINERTKTGEETLLSLRMELGLVPHDDVSDKAISNDSLVDYKLVRPGQMVMNRMRAAIGIFGVSSRFGLVSPDYAVFDIKERANSSFFLRLFKLPLLGTQFRLGSKGLGTGSSGFMRLYTENFGDIKVAVPPLGEQLEILKFIDSTSERLDNACTVFEQQITKLKEYKSTLINSAVTGKIKVPGVVEPAEIQEREIA